MYFLINIASDWKLIVAVGGAAIVVLIILAIFINKGKYASRYKNFYKRMDKTIQKKYNGNLLNEEIVNTFARDNTNTYKSLKAKGKRKVKKYLEYYVKNLPELVFLKSFISPDKKKSQLLVLVLNEMDKVVYRWEKSRKLRGLLKGINKHQMLTSVIGYFFDLPIHIHEGAPLRMTNHDNALTMSYDIVKNARSYKRKQKQKKLTKKEIKAQAKIEATKQKKLKKAKR